MPDANGPGRHDRLPVRPLRIAPFRAAPAEQPPPQRFVDDAAPPDLGSLSRQYMERVFPIRCGPMTVVHFFGVGKVKLSSLGTCSGTSELK